MRAKQEEKNGFDGDSILHATIFGFCIIVIFFILVFAEAVVFVVVFSHISSYKRLSSGIFHGILNNFFHLFLLIF